MLLQAAAPPADGARQLGIFAELELLNVVADLNMPTADQVLLDLVTMIATDEATVDGVTAAVELFQQYGLIEIAFGQPGWSRAEFLSRLNQTIEHLDDMDPDNTRAEAYAWSLANV